ncbi:MAG TPA: hypothetical protein GX711_07460 [Clostridia bacterium]|nr:hypothetical protein [Clostridia bacterium]
MMVVIFVGALLIVFAIILVLPFRLEINYRKELKNDLLQIGMGISHFSLLRLRIPSLKFYQKMVDGSLEFPAQLQVGRDITLWERHFILGRPLELLADIGRFFSGKVGRILINNYPDLIKISRQFLKNVTCHRLEWATQIGSSDASLTGYTAGLLWWIKFSLYRLLS